jgi:hypothetical protein
MEAPNRTLPPPIVRCRGIDGREGSHDDDGPGDPGALFVTASASWRVPPAEPPDPLDDGFPG